VWEAALLQLCGWRGAEAPQLHQLLIPSARQKKWGVSGRRPQWTGKPDSRARALPSCFCWEMEKEGELGWDGPARSKTGGGQD
jgi:hypothetical protein